MDSVTDIGSQVYVDPADRLEFVRLMEEHGEVVNHGCRFRRRDGTEFWVSRNVRAVRDGVGRIVAYQGFNMDVTEQKQAEEREGVFIKMLQNTDQIAVFKDTELRYKMINPAYTRLTGHTLDNVLGKTDRELFHGISTPEQIAAYMENDRRALGFAPGAAVTIEEGTLGSDGELRHYLTKKFPVHDKDGHLLGVGTITSDITEWKQTEGLLRKSEERYRRIVETANEGIREG